MDGKRGLALIDRIRRRLPDVALRTTLILGFPGEGRREFAALKDFVSAARFDHLGVFTYSPEDSTPAFRWGDRLPESEKELRRAEIMSLQAGISRSILRRHLHRRLDVLLERPGGEDGGTLAGRTRFQAPEVDGMVHVRTESAAERPLGAIVRVEITSTGVYDLRGKLAR
jgi:ribosomal protein S12 methylthiotransferase